MSAKLVGYNYIKIKRKYDINRYLQEQSDNSSLIVEIKRTTKLIARKSNFSNRHIERHLWEQRKNGYQNLIRDKVLSKSQKVQEICYKLNKSYCLFRIKYTWLPVLALEKNVQSSITQPMLAIANRKYIRAKFTKLQPGQKFVLSVITNSFIIMIMMSDTISPLTKKQNIQLSM